MHFSALNRRRLLVGSAATLAGCASAEATPQAATGTEAADAEFYALVDRLAERTPSARPFLIRQFNPLRLTARGRILYDSILPGAEAEATLTDAPWGKNGAPFSVSTRNGAFRRAADLNPADDLRIAIREVNRDTNRLEVESELGVIAPDFTLDAAIRDVAAAAERVAARNEERLTPLVEALTRQAETLRGQRTRATSEAGVWRLPGGEDFYLTTLQLQLGAPVNPREAHNEARERCRALQREADTLLRAQGLTRGSVGDRLRALAQDPSHHVGAGDDAIHRALLDMAGRLSRVRALLTDVIPDGVSASTTPAEVARLPQAQEANGTAGRRTGSTYYVDFGAPRPIWTLPSVVHHELVPGHVLQNYFLFHADALELQGRYSNGYNEGWSIYAEQLADDLGAFNDDPLGRLGYLQWMLFRYGRIVADTGINALRWSRERAIQELRTLQGDSIAFVTIEDDVTRFCVQPGLYTAQGLAALQISELREQTRRRARDFTMARFHAAMLRHGLLSPPGLTQAVRAEFGA